jgi:hypothetical protein
MIKSQDLGLRTKANSFKTQDFHLGWTIWPPDLEVTGVIYFSSVDIDLYLVDTWYDLWPL